MNLSVNDELEEFMEKLQIGEDFKESVSSYFLPELTEEELKLVELKNEDHLKTYFSYGLPGTKSWTSETKYLQSNCFRWSFKIQNPSIVSSKKAQRPKLQL